MLSSKIIFLLIYCVVLLITEGLTCYIVVVTFTLTVQLSWRTKQINLIYQDRLFYWIELIQRTEEQ